MRKQAYNALAACSLDPATCPQHRHPAFACSCQPCRLSIALYCLQVREQAYRALAAYSLDDLEALDVEQPTGDAARLLLQEQDPTAQKACEALVAKALSYEHARRRRCGSSGLLISCLNGIPALALSACQLVRSAYSNATWVMH